MTPIAVTGATGGLGGRVARRLAAAGVEQVLVVRDPSRAPELPGARLAKASYDDSAAVQSALAGVQTVFMVSGAEAPNRVDQHRSFVDAAVAAGVEHLVYTSFDGASPDSTFLLGRDHWATEEHIRGSGLRFTFLRDNLYADFMPMMVGDDGVIRGPGGAGRAAVVARDDIADVAAVVLGDPQAHIDATYVMTGPEALSFAEMAETLSVVLGRTITYVEETLDEAYASRAHYGAPQWQVDAWVSTYVAVANGDLSAVSDDIPRLTGHPATSLADVVRNG